jgi:hypothetical protein
VNDTLSSIINWPTALTISVVAIVVAAVASLLLHERKVWGSVRFGVFLERKRRLNGDNQQDNEREE